MPIKNFYQTSSAQLPIDPYFLGLWLGDGSSTSISITTTDKEIVDYISEYAKKLELKVKAYPDKKTKVKSYSIIKSGKGASKSYNSLKNTFYALNLLTRDKIKNKHIPLSYLTSSKENRLQLLAGLIDTDGWVQSNLSIQRSRNRPRFGYYCITQKSDTLTKNILMLARSLGFKCSNKRYLNKQYNKYYNYRKLPDALAFFNGKRFVPLMVILWSVIISLVLAVIWPVVQTGINAFGVWIANSSDTSPVLAPFIYGTLERLLLPFGLHHMLTIPMNYTSFGGTYTMLTGTNAGSQVFGQDPLWLAWVTDLINLKNAGDMEGYQTLLATVTPARFKVGQMIGATGLLLGIALAMYRRVDADKKKSYRSMFLSTVLAVFLTGVTEPLEFMFMFCALPLYLVYAVLQGCAFAMAGIIDLRLHSFGNLEFLTRVPMSVQAGLTRDIINFIICVVAFFIIGYFVAYFMIGKFRFATPGRLGNYTDDSGADEDTPVQASAPLSTAGGSQAERIIGLLGGRENITLVDACMTRLRVTVKDPGLVADTAAWKAEGAMGLIKKDNGIQAVYGPKADVLKSDINDIL